MNAPPMCVSGCEEVSVKIHRVLLEASSVGWVNGSIPNGHSNSNPSSNPKGGRQGGGTASEGKPGNQDNTNGSHKPQREVKINSAIFAE